MSVRIKPTINISGSFGQATGKNKKHFKEKTTTRLYILLIVREQVQLGKLAASQAVSFYIREKLLGKEAEKRCVLRKPKMEDIQYAMLLAAIGISPEWRKVTEKR